MGKAHVHSYLHAVQILEVSFYWTAGLLVRRRSILHHHFTPSISTGLQLLYPGVEQGERGREEEDL